MTTTAEVAEGEITRVTREEMVVELFQERRWKSMTGDYEGFERFCGYRVPRHDATRFFGSRCFRRSDEMNGSDFFENNMFVILVWC